MAKKATKAKSVKKGQDEGLKFLQSIGIKIAKNQSALKNDMVKRYGQDLYLEYINMLNGDMEDEVHRQFTAEHPEFVFEYDASSEGTYIRQVINVLTEKMDYIGKKVLIRTDIPLFGMYLAKNCPDSEVVIGMPDLLSEEYCQYLMERLEIPKAQIISGSAPCQDASFDTVIYENVDFLGTVVTARLAGIPFKYRSDKTEDIWKRKAEQVAGSLKEDGYFIDLSADPKGFFIDYAWFMNQSRMLVDTEAYRKETAYPIGKYKFTVKPILAQKKEILDESAFYQAFSAGLGELPKVKEKSVKNDEALIAEALLCGDLIDGIVHLMDEGVYGDPLFIAGQFLYQSKEDPELLYAFETQDNGPKITAIPAEEKEHFKTFLDGFAQQELEDSTIYRVSSDEELRETLKDVTTYQLKDYAEQYLGEATPRIAEPILLTGVKEELAIADEEDAASQDETENIVTADEDSTVTADVAAENTDKEDAAVDDSTVTADVATESTGGEATVEDNTASANIATANTAGKVTAGTVNTATETTAGKATAADNAATAEPKPFRRQMTPEEEEVYRKLSMAHLYEKQTKDRKNGREFMGQYIGKVDCYGSQPTIYYNFMPIYRISESRLDPLYSYDRQQLLPDSENENINLYYDTRYAEQSAFMSRYFCNNMLAIMSFDPDELEHNIWKGTMNKTGYKVTAQEAWKKKRIVPLSTAGYYQVIPENALPEKLESANIVELNNGDYVVDEEILVDCGDGFLAGPYSVKFREADAKFIIRPKIRENKYVLLGYNSKDCRKLRFDNDDNDLVWTRYVIPEDAMPVERDVMTDEELLNSFLTSIKGMGLNLTQPSDQNVSDIVQRYVTSYVQGKNLSVDTIKQRENRLMAILRAEERLEEILGAITDVLADLIVKYQDTPAVDKMLEVVLENKPELLENLPNSRVMRSRMAAAKQELEQMEQTKRAAIEKMEQDLQLNQMNEQMEKKQKQLDRMQERLEQYSAVRSLETRLAELKKSVAEHEQHKEKLQQESKVLEVQFETMLERYRNKLLDVSFDGFMSSRMLQAAARWEHTTENDRYEKMVADMNGDASADLSPAELVDYVVQLVQIERPQYDRNLIINLLVCMFQGFLTVFSGEPGCGKTSICNILAKILGMTGTDNSFSSEETDRYIPVSVGRGWTSKNDFIGYYNPLTKSFEENNRQVYEGLKMLNLEYKLGYKKYPFVILLDEANLSPMEFYWADFMNVCDDRINNHVINLGNENVFSIPETLHFVATINNDHTTQVLSPRLIDRAWIISLPRNKFVEYGGEIPAEKIRRITWKSISDAFVLSQAEKPDYSNEVQDIYEGMKSILIQEEIVISPRMELAIRKYWNTASRLMEDTDYCEASVVALDYAIAQKILPKISGMGEEYMNWLDKIKVYCNDNGLQISGNIIQNIINKGNRRMRDYQFFN